MKQLHLSAELAFPLSTVTDRLGWLGTTGSGKTYGAMRMAELMIEAKAQVIVLDPVGPWYGLRLGADGKSPGIPIPVFGGLHGDVPLEPTGGRLMADLVVDQSLSCIIDVSQFEFDTEKAKFGADFMNRFYFRKKASPSAVHVFLEEGQEFIPQNPQRGEEQMLHAFIRAWKMGRNCGIGGSIVSQRPQEVNKKALNLSHTMFAFQTTGSHERKAIEEWMRDKNIDVDLADELPRLKNGAPYVWAPGWLKESVVVKISKKWTFDASKTPEVGEKAVEVRALAPIEVTKLSEQMKSSIEKARANDPALLKKRILELEKKLSSGKAVSAPAIDEAYLQKALVRVQNLVGEKYLQQLNEKISENAMAVLAIVEKEQSRLTAALRDYINRLPKTPVVAIDAGEWNKHGKEIHDAWLSTKAVVRVKHMAAPAQEQSPEGGDGLQKAKRQILNSLAWWEALGHEAPSREMVAYVASFAPGRYFRDQMGSLKSAGLLDYPGDNLLALTSQGRAMAQAPTSEPTGAQLRDRILHVLSGTEGRLFDALWTQGQVALERPALATIAGFGTPGRYFKDQLGRLRTLRLCDYPTPTSVRLTDWIIKLQ